MQAGRRRYGCAALPLFHALQDLAAQGLEKRGLLLGQPGGKATLDLLADGQANLVQLLAARLELDLFVPAVLRDAGAADHVLFLHQREHLGSRRPRDEELRLDILLEDVLPAMVIQEIRHPQVHQRALVQERTQHLHWNYYPPVR